MKHRKFVHTAVCVRADKTVLSRSRGNFQASGSFLREGIAKSEREMKK